MSRKKAKADLPIVCFHPDTECLDPEDCACECGPCMSAWLETEAGK